MKAKNFKKTYKLVTRGHFVVEGGPDDFVARQLGYFYMQIESETSEAKEKYHYFYDEMALYEDLPVLSIDTEITEALAAENEGIDIEDYRIRSILFMMAACYQDSVFDFDKNIIQKYLDACNNIVVFKKWKRIFNSF